MTLATPNDLLSASGSAGSATTQAFEITNTGTAPDHRGHADRRPRRPAGTSPSTRRRPAVDRAGDAGTITATITPVERGRRRRLRRDVQGRAAETSDRRDGPDPLHGRDLAALGAHRDRHHRADPGRPVLRLPHLRPTMSATPGRIALRSARPGPPSRPLPPDRGSAPARPTRPRATDPDPDPRPDQALRRPRRGRPPRPRRPGRRDLRPARPERRGQDHDDPDAARADRADRGRGPRRRARPARGPLEVKRRVGYMPDSVGFYGDLTGRENLRYTARLNRHRRPRRPRRRSTRCSSRSA